MMMLNKKYISRLLLLPGVVFVLISSSPVVSAREAIAMVTDLTGKASITTDGDKKACEILMSLYAGDEINVVEGSKLTIVYFNSAKEYIFSGNTLISVKSEGPKNNRGSKAETRELAIIKDSVLLPSGENYSQAAIVLRGERKKPKIKLIYPVNSKVIDPRPTFEWLPIEKVIQYRFILTDESGRTVIETLANGNSFKLPVENNIEEGVLYSWQVEARLSTGAVYSNSTSFSLIDEDELEKINRLRPKDKATYSERVVFAILLEQMGVRDEAYDYWKALASERPDNELLKAKAKE